MIEVIDGGKHPDWAGDLLDDYMRANVEIDMSFNGKGSESVIAVKEGSPAGIILFDRNPSFRINMIHTYSGHDDAVEPMLKSIMAMAAVMGNDSLTVHSVDRDGKLRELLFGMGFRMGSECPCCQREDTIHMRYDF